MAIFVNSPRRIALRGLLAALVLHLVVLEPAHAEAALDDPTPSLAELRQTVESHASRFGPEHRRVAAPLIELGRRLREEGKFAEAEPVVRRALKIHERTFGGDHRRARVPMRILANVLMGLGRHGEALPLFERALKIARKSFGDHHEETASSMRDLAGMLHHNGDPRALKLLTKAHKILKQRLGKANPGTLLALNDLAEITGSLGQFKAGEQLMRELHTLSRSTFGENHEFTLESYHNVGYMRYRQGAYKDAAQIYAEVLPRLKLHIGEEQALTARCMDNYGIALRFMGQLDAAERMYRQALRIRMKLFDEFHAETAVTLSNLADVLGLTGQYREAERLSRRAVAVTEKLHGKAHYLTANCLYGLANLLTTRGNIRDALPIMARVLDIFESTHPPGHPSTTFAATYMGILRLSTGDFDNARVLLRRSLIDWEKTGNPDHPTIASVASNLAYAELALGNLAEAQALEQRALNIARKVHGEQHYVTALTLNHVAAAQMAQGEYTQSEQHIRKALDILITNYPPVHPNTATVRKNLLRALQHRGAHAEAETQLRTILDTEDEIIRRLVLTGTVRQRDEYALSLAWSSSSSVIFAATTGRRTAETLALRSLLRRKAIFMDMGTDIARLAARAQGQERQTLERFRTVTESLAKLALSPPATLSSEELRTRNHALVDEQEQLERQLTDRYAEFALKHRRVQVADVASRLPAHARLVEFVIYDGDALDRGHRSVASPAKPSYAAFVLSPEGEVNLVPLGPARTIDAAVAAFRNALASPNSNIKKPARQLHELVFAPLNNALGGALELFVSPDGALNLVPFAALVNDAGDYLVDRYRINYLTSGADLLRLRDRAAWASPALIVGGPAFGSGETAQTPPPSTVADAAEGDRSLDWHHRQFKPLRGAAAEVRRIAELLPQNSQLHVGEAATEDVVKAVHAPRFLHIATHGFFLNGTGTNLNKVQNRGLIALGRGLLRQLPENPMLRSGLVLAGANDQHPEGQEDGVLTALEVANLDLWGTQMVVLSACETGLGTVKNGRGVYGLRRALVQAGSETQLVSLWRVNDRSAESLMVEYYRRVLRGEPRGEAMRSVQLEAIEANAGREHPYYWAPFIVQGDPRSLDYEWTVADASAPAEEPPSHGRSRGCMLGPGRDSDGWLALLSVALVAIRSRPPFAHLGSLRRTQRARGLVNCEFGHLGSSAGWSTPQQTTLGGQNRLRPRTTAT